MSKRLLLKFSLLGGLLLLKLKHLSGLLLLEIHVLTKYHLEDRHFGGIVHNELV